MVVVAVARPDGTVNTSVVNAGVLADPVVHDGTWRLVDVARAWDGNDSHERVVAFTWTTTDGDVSYVVAVNLADTWSQGYVALAHGGLPGQQITLTDRLGPEHYERDGDEIVGSGLYVDLGPWAHNVFAVEAT